MHTIYLKIVHEKTKKKLVIMFILKLNSFWSFFIAFSEERVNQTL